MMSTRTMILGYLLVVALGVASMTDELGIFGGMIAFVVGMVGLGLIGLGCMIDRCVDKDSN